VLEGIGTLEPAADPGHFLLSLAPDATLGAAIAALTAEGVEIVACRDESQPLERAFLAVTGDRAA
jgi:hypothetical protein